MFGLCEIATTVLVICIIVLFILMVIIICSGNRESIRNPQVLVCGFGTFCLGAALILMITAVIQDRDIERSMTETLEKNYSGYSNLNETSKNSGLLNGEREYSFIYDKQKYICNFEYYNDKTLTVFLDGSSAIDSVYVDGKKQNDKNTENGKIKSTEVSSQSDIPQTDDVSADGLSVAYDTSNDEDFTAKIQNRILERYNGVTITSFDTTNFTGSFAYKNDTYDFSWTDDTLKVKNTSDPSDFSYYNVAN